MFCESCGKELKDGAKFCVHCGGLVKPEAVADFDSVCQDDEPVHEDAGIAHQEAAFTAGTGAPAAVPHGPARPAFGHPPTREERRVLAEKVRRGDGGLFIGWFRIWTNILFGLMTVGSFAVACVLGSEEQSFGAGLLFFLLALFILFGCYAFYMLILSGFENMKRTADNTALMAELMKRREEEGARPQKELAD